jgi:hypothetical protein
VWALLMAGFAISNSIHLHCAQAQVSQISNLKWVVRFFAAVAFVSLLFALGRFLPFFPLLYKAVSGVALFQGPARLLSVYTLTVAALAGLGTEQLLESDRWRSLGRSLLVASAGVVLATLAGTALIGIRTVFVRPVIQFGVTLGACAACLAFRPVVSPAGAGAKFRLWQAALIVIVAADLLVADWRLNPTTDTRLYRTPTESAQAVRMAGDGRVLWFADDETDIKFKQYLNFIKFGSEDPAYWLGMRETLLPNAGMIDRVPTANNFDPLLPNRYNELMKLLNNLPAVDALEWQA